MSSGSIKATPTPLAGCLLVDRKNSSSPSTLNRRIRSEIFGRRKRSWRADPVFIGELPFVESSMLLSPPEFPSNYYGTPHGESGSNACRMAWVTWRICRPESARGRRSPRRDFLRVVMKWPFIQEGPGSPVSPGSRRRVVGPSTPWLPNGTIKTESTRSLVFLVSSDTTKTQ